MKPITFKYRQGKDIKTIKADSCYGEFPAHSNTYYCNFLLNNVKVARVPESRLLPGFKRKYDKLYGRPWLEDLAALKEITLSAYENWSHELRGYPDDTSMIWSIDYRRDWWVIVAGDPNKNKVRAILHIPNNPEITRRGSNTMIAIKRLFPKQKVVLMQPTITEIEL